MGNLKIIAGTGLVISIVTCMISCDRFEDITPKNYVSVETQYYDMDFEIEAMDKAGYQIFTEKFFEPDLTALLEKAGYNTDMIEEIEVQEILVNLRETTDYQNFKNIRFIEVSVYTDDLGESAIASLDPVPQDQISVELNLDGIDVSSYFKEEQFMISVQGFLKERINKAMKLHASVKFRLKLQI